MNNTHTNRDELIKEAIELIMISSDTVIKAALEAALNTEDKQ